MVIDTGVPTSIGWCMYRPTPDRDMFCMRAVQKYVKSSLPALTSATPKRGTLGCLRSRDVILHINCARIVPAMHERDEPKFSLFNNVEKYVG